MSLCLELIWGVFPDHQTSSFSICLSLIISLCTRLNSHMQSKEKIAEVDQRGENERRGGRTEGWSTRGLREQGFSNSMFSGSCLLQSTSWCIIQVSLPSAIFVPLFTKPVFLLLSQPLPCLLVPYWCLLSSFYLFIHLSSPFLTPSPLPPHLPSLLLSFILSHSALWSSSEAVQSNPLIGVRKCWKCGGSFPWARALLRIRALCEAHSLWDRLIL